MNEGQARLADLLRQNEDIHIHMPDWMSEKRTLFTSKYPSFESNWQKKRKAAEKRKHLNLSSDNAPVEKIANLKKVKLVEKQDSENKLEKALEEIFRDEDDKQGTKATGAQASENTPRKRARRLPKRYV